MQNAKLKIKESRGQAVWSNIVTIGGGSGQFVLLSGLRELPGLDITAIVSMADSGGSTGRLRDELGVLPPGDILKCLLALSPIPEARRILLKRFQRRSRLKGHSAGNMLLTMLSQYTDSFPDGVNALGEILGIKGRVLPVTTDKATLVAELADGCRLYGEKVIDMPKISRRQRIAEMYLVPHHNEAIAVYPPVVDAIRQAGYIIIGPGDLYTSLTPNFLVNGVKEAIKRTRAKIIFIVNIMTKSGETDNFPVTAFIDSLERSIGREIDYAVVNSGRPPAALIKKYAGQKARLVRIDTGETWGSRKIIKADLLNKSGKIVRHDSRKLADIINNIITKK